MLADLAQKRLRTKTPRLIEAMTAPITPLPPGKSSSQSVYGLPSVGISGVAVDEDKALGLIAGNPHPVCRAVTIVHDLQRRPGPCVAVGLSLDLREQRE